MQLHEIIQTLDAKHPGIRLKDSELFDCACLVAQREFSSKTWRNWKSLPQWESPSEMGPPIVAPYAETLSWGQALVLMAIAYSRHNAHPTKPLPSNDEIWWILHSPFPGKFMLKEEFFEALVSDRFRAWHKTSELPHVLRNEGYKGVELTSLYGKIGHLIKGRSKHFPHHIKQYCEALDKLVGKRGRPKKTERVA